LGGAGHAQRLDLPYQGDFPLILAFSLGGDRTRSNILSLVRERIEVRVGYFLP